MRRETLLGGLVAALIVAGGVVAVSSDRYIGQQSRFAASGTGATSRTIESKLRDSISVKDFSGSDFCAQLTTAIAAVGAGGIIHAESVIGTQVCASNLTINQSGLTIILPSAQINIGANQIVVPVGTYNVAMIGSAPFGSYNAETQTGTFINYTGSGVAVVVGDSTGDTNGFTIQDVTININTAGSAAIGLQLNRAGECNLTRPRVIGLATANTQKLIDLEGFTNFTGCKIDQPWLSHGLNAIYWGAAANSTWVIGGYYLGLNNGTGTALNFAGAVGNPAVGNVVIGGDVEQWGTVMNFDYARDTQIYGLRTETSTNLATATANSTRNLTFTNGITLPITDNGTYNGFATVLSPVISQTKIQIHNKQDVPSNLWVGAGLTADQDRFISFLDKTESPQWRFWVDNANVWSLQHQTGLIREQLASGNSFYNAEAGGGILFNSGTNTGTGGVQFWSGGASPTKVGAVDSIGRYLLGVVLQANLGTPGNGTIVYCSDCTIANPCAGGGTGAFAQRINGIWVCDGGPASAGSEHDFCAYNAANLAGATAFARSVATNASTLTADSTITHDIAGAGTGTFVAKLCSDGTTCGAGNVYLTCTAGANCATAAAGRIDACTVTKAAVPAATTLTWSVATACGTTDPGINACAHFTTP